MPQTSCDRCKLPELQCICGEIEPVPCGIEVLILRHHLEAERTSNTGRLIPWAIASASIQTYAAPGDAIDLTTWLHPEATLLYPTQGAHSHRPTQLVVLDGTWSQARRMYQRNPALHSLPKLSLAAPAAPLPRMRLGRTPEQMSTAESVIAALRALGEPSAADHLERTLREVVRRFSLPQRKGPRRQK